jgi:EAL domain-containing protein (putative c-di-GMP-specific phosphodiesterase class I)
MYQAKAGGKARHEVFDIAMHAGAIALLQLETDLRRAIERQEFRVHYQPIVSLKSGRINGFEALVRWQHPDRGLVSPIEFIPVAEETGLIVAIGLWVLREACRQMHEWQVQFPANPPLTISVNISGKQFLQPDLSEQRKC